MDYKIIKFTASWCSQCQVMDINLHKAGINYSNIDVDNNYEIAEEYTVKNLPVIIVTDGMSNVIDRFNGIMTVKQIQDKLSKYNQ